jgi:hypothetical protein
MRGIASFPIDYVRATQRQEAEEVRRLLSQGKTPRQVENMMRVATLVENASIDPTDVLGPTPPIDFLANSAFAPQDDDDETCYGCDDDDDTLLPPEL